MLAFWLTAIAASFFLGRLQGDELEVVSVEGQPLGANAARLLEALQYLGSPLPDDVAHAVHEAAAQRDADRLQRLLDPHVLLEVSLNPESRVKVRRGPAKARLQQAGFTPVLVKVVNQSTVTKRLRISSPQAGPNYAGVAELSMKRQQQEPLRENENLRGLDRFLEVEMFASPPLTDRLSGLEAEYALALIYSSEAGKREATISFDVQQGEQDLGFRGEAPVLFEVAPAVPVTVHVADDDGQPTTARLLFRDAQGRVYPPQARRLAPDLFFQPHIYRQSGEQVLLPPGQFALHYGRGPEYLVQQTRVVVDATGENRIDLQLTRWVRPADYGWFSGDHHIHGAGCAHYTSPTEGIGPEDMFRQVKGEGLNVGAVLTWGPCFDYQRRFFAPEAHDISEPWTVLKYDLEISGFGSQALGHVCLLNLKDQTYPGSDGKANQGWPTWTTPVMRWAKEQGGVTGYAHSASGLHIDPAAAADRLLTRGDGDRDQKLSQEEASALLLPDRFESIDTSADRSLDRAELIASHEAAADRLPNLAIPEMNGVGAMETFVSVAEGVCDFISAMDTARIQEWNTWYHILNCGFPLKVSGETDFPCMSSRNVGQGRVYVQMQGGEAGSPLDSLDYGDWCRALAAGRSYVSDGYAHALEFTVNGVQPGSSDVALDAPGMVRIRAKVAFAREMPLAVAHGGVIPAAGRRVVGDTVLLHGPRTEETQIGGERLVEIIVNGQPVASQAVPADGQIHQLEFQAPITGSSWVALRQFPQLHTNPVNVLVAGKPIRASRQSARWCLECIELLWKNRERTIAVAERQAAKEAFDRAAEVYRRIASAAAGD